MAVQQGTIMTTVLGQVVAHIASSPPQDVQVQDELSASE